MCKSVYKPTIVLCEGLSEESYVHQLNVFFRSQGNNKITLVPKIIGGNKPAIKRWKKLKTENRNIRCVVWMDGDIYKREKAPLPKIPKDDLLLNTYNFEDFLVMHLDRNSAMKWQQICFDLDHFSKPITAKVCEEKIKAIFLQYRKGSMPSEITVCEESLKNLFDNQNDNEILFASDFAVFLRKLFSWKNY